MNFALITRFYASQLKLAALTVAYSYRTNTEQFALTLNFYLCLFKPANFAVKNSFSHHVRREQLERVTEECCRHCMQSLEESSGRVRHAGCQLLLSAGGGESSLTPQEELLDWN